jgi:hypothetical protein
MDAPQRKNGSRSTIIFIAKRLPHYYFQSSNTSRKAASSAV